MDEEEKEEDEKEDNEEKDEKDKDEKEDKDPGQTGSIWLKQQTDLSRAWGILIQM